MTRRSAITVALIAALLSPALVAETVYVRDTLYVPLRVAPSEDARFVRALNALLAERVKRP